MTQFQSNIFAFFIRLDIFVNCLPTFNYQHIYSNKGSGFIIGSPRVDQEIFVRGTKRLSPQKKTDLNLMGDSSQFSPLTTLSEQLGPNSWVSSVFIPAFIAKIGKHFS